MHALVRIDQNRAAAVLRDYVREPDADILPTAIHFLAVADKASAQQEAHALLLGPRASSLDGNTKRQLRAHAGIPEPDAR
jgi:hypothetical protein